MTKPKIAIIGGGISGLSCAHRLIELQRENQSDLEVHLFEGSSRLGGTIETEKRDGFILEKGPDSFLSEKPWGVNLSKRLGIESEIIGTRNEFRKSFVVRKGKLHELPEGFYLIAPTRIGSFFASPLFSWLGKVRTCAEWVVPKRENSKDESISSFIKRRFGHEVLERVGQAMLAGIYSGDPDRLSLEATMPRFRELEKKYGSVIRGLFMEAEKRKEIGKASGPRYSLFLSFREGMEMLIVKLKETLSGDSIHLNSQIDQITYDFQNRSWRLTVKDGHIYEVNFICLALPVRQVSQLFSGFDGPLSQMLAGIPYESVATINFAFKRTDITHPLDGFGFVVPAIEKSSLIACSFNSVKFDHRAPKNFVLLRAFVGGAFGKRFFAMDDADLTKCVLQDLSSYLGIQGKPLFTTLSRYENAMVQYEVGHRELVSQIEERVKRFKGLFLTGSSYRGAGIPDCIFDAERSAEEIYQELSSMRAMVGSEW